MSARAGNSAAFLTTDEVADRWRMSRRTLEGWRDKGVGPTYHKLGSRVRYRIDDVERFESQWRSSEQHFDA